ncbi:DUF2231 domain-containing protein [Georgenia thermotolerans]|uniref:DUF2231 domain-containing protein n=1 Tax=Georgenia thermotolerans TaxID=527326 RepID=A0A7J5UNS8_9MICO|nr:DUF2231 domain-containing protein [Georgenia thermotolerans]KAE8763920.1 hypothetical protein GB883_11750 [Georgenia thermotolerans]
MFDLINGLPMHPLVVHAVVVLVPLTVLGTLAVVLVPRWRRYAPVVAVLATVAAFFLPLATQSGEALARRVGTPSVHAELGEQLLYIGVVLAAILWVLVLVERRHGRVALLPGDRVTARPGTPVGAGPGAQARRSGNVLTTAVAALAVVVALGAGVQCYRVGDSGARAAWGGVAQTTPQHTEREAD